MSLLGNVHGPLAETILRTIGAENLGLTRPQFLARLAFEETSSSHYRVEPVRLDEHGKPFVTISGYNDKAVTWYVTSPLLYGHLYVEVLTDVGREVWTAEMTDTVGRRWRKVAKLPF